MLPLSPELARVMARANHEAKRLRSARLEPEHLLLGMCASDPSVAQDPLLPCEVSLPRLRLHCEKLTSFAGCEVVRDVLPPSPTTRRVLMDAAGEARSRGHPEVERAHVLASLLRDRGGMTAYLLERVGADPTAIRAAALAVLDGAHHRPAPVPAQLMGKPAEVLVYAHLEPSRRERRIAVAKQVAAALFALLTILSIAGSIVLLYRML